MSTVTYGIGTWRREDEYSESADLTTYTDEGVSESEYDLHVFRSGDDGINGWSGFSREKNAFNATASVVNLSHGEVKRALIDATVNCLERLSNELGR